VLTFNASRFFIVASVVCFTIALLTAVAVVTSDENAWVAGGLLALALSFATP
jgi:hypothetical protein